MSNKTITKDQLSNAFFNAMTSEQMKKYIIADPTLLVIIPMINSLIDRELFDE
jgi:hypothetical protein